jgi:hypothetical protein
MNPRTREHKEDIVDELFFNGTSSIPKDMDRDDMKFFVVHVICDGCSILPSKEN